MTCFVFLFFDLDIIDKLFFRRKSLNMCSSLGRGISCHQIILDQVLL